MISGINGAGGFMNHMGMEAMRPDPKERFNRADTNGDMSLDKSEMQTVLDRISEMSGEDINVDDFFLEFDTDENDVFSEQEAEIAMAQLRERIGPEMMGKKGGGPRGMGGPRGVEAYENDKVNEIESSLISMLNSLSDDDKESFLTALQNGIYSPLDILV